MVSRCLQASTLASNGCERRSFLVLFLYNSQRWRDSLKLEGVIEFWDMVLAVKGWRKEMEIER